MSTIKEVFQFPVKNERLFQQAFQLNGFAKPFLPVINSLDTLAIDFFRWQLIPTWIKDEKDLKADTLNARAEGIFESSTYKPYWHKRCLIICTGFFEPHQVKGEDPILLY